MAEPSAAAALAIEGGRPAVTAPHPPTWPQVSPAARAFALDLLDRGSLSDYEHGEVVAELEEEVRGLHDGVRFVLATSSGTAALHSAYVGLGLRRGDEVLVPAYTFHATVTPLFLCDAVPVLVDCLPDVGTIDVRDAAHRITDRTRAIVVNHLWGHPAAMDGVLELAAAARLRIVEDCSHAHGARYRGKRVGTIGDVGVFSLGAAKPVSGGMGGVLITADRDIYERALLLGHCHERSEPELVDGSRGAFASAGWGANYRISTLAAAVCIDQWRTLDERNGEKRALLERLSDHIRPLRGLTPPPTLFDDTRGGWYGYKALYDSDAFHGLPMEALIEALHAEGLLVGRPSGLPLHLLPTFQRADSGPPSYDPGRPRPLYGPSDFPGAESYYERSLSFPAPRFHGPCDRLIDEYGDGLRKVTWGGERLVKRWRKAAV